MFYISFSLSLCLANILVLNGSEISELFRVANPYKINQKKQHEKRVHTSFNINGFY